MSIYNRVLKGLTELFHYKKKEEEPKNDMVLPKIGNMYDLSKKLKIMDLQSEPGFADAHLYYGSTYEGVKKRKFTIPVKNLNQEQADQIKALMSDYRTDWPIWNNSQYNLPKKAGKQIFSDIDPYGEENWEEDVDETVKPSGILWEIDKRNGGLSHFKNNTRISKSINKTF